MTDTFVVNEDADYTVGKAQSTPDNEYQGILSSYEDAVTKWGIPQNQGFSDLRGIVYSGTAMLNRLLERNEDESDIGVITTGGFEDTLRFGRAIQSWAGGSYASRLHAREHEHPEPLVPRENIQGVRERTNVFGMDTIPLYEDEVRDAVHDLIDKDVEVICICLLASYANDSHEQRANDIAEEIIEERGEDIEVWLSNDQNPTRGELPRLNTLVMEAYAVEPSREQLYDIRNAFRGEGADAPFRILTSSGGTVSPDHDWLVDTMLSGPIGGIFGGEFLANELGIDNLVCSDVGGTSFDVGLITEGHYPTRWDSALAQFMVNIPMTAIDSIGSGTGSFVRVDPTSNRIEVGPDSAGYLVGVSNEDSGLDTPTVTDCTAALGYVNDEYFLGGDIPLNVERAEEYIEDQVANPIGEDIHDTARGVLDIVERDMAHEIRAMVLGLGYRPENYNIISYGGGGPLHTAGYTDPLDFKDILIPQWAAAFSAFGCSCTDAAYRYDQQVDMIVQPDMSNAWEIANDLNDVFDELREKAIEAFERDEADPGDMTFEGGVRLQYLGMLDDLEVKIPAEVMEDGLDENSIQTMVDRYEEKFEQIFKRAAQSPENGFQITTAIGNGVASSPKPAIPDEELGPATPPESASRGERPIYWDDDWHDAQLWEMRDLLPGNEVTGPSVIEAPATTILVPPGFEVELDNHRIYHLDTTEEYYE